MDGRRFESLYDQGVCLSSELRDCKEDISVLVATAGNAPRQYSVPDDED
jgi:hypothetical protein